MKEIDNQSQNLFWVYPHQDLDWQKAIANEFNIHPATAQVLVSRGFKTFEEIYDFYMQSFPICIVPVCFVK